MMTMSVYAQLKDELRELAKRYSLNGDAVDVSAATLSPHEAIGAPEERDCPLVKGRERMMQAVFRGACGQAFTDLYGNWHGTIHDLIEMDLANNFRRAVLVSSLNAVMRALGLIERTVHCKDGDPKRCGRECLAMFRGRFPSAVVTMIGYQPRIFEQLRKSFMTYVVDMDPENVGRMVAGTKIVGPGKTDKYVEKADVLFVTGTSLVNNTIGRFLRSGKQTIFYGVTVAGAANVLGLTRHCPFAL